VGFQVCTVPVVTVGTDGIPLTLVVVVGVVVDTLVAEVVAVEAMYTTATKAHIILAVQVVAVVVVHLLSIQQRLEVAQRFPG
jgi:hypothetical protein